MKLNKEEIKAIQEKLFAIPPDIEVAKKHAQAQQVRYYDTRFNIENNRCF